MNFPFYKQFDKMDCGPACLRMIAKYYGGDYALTYLREQSHITREGVSMLGISDAAETIGFRTLAVKVTAAILSGEAPLPCILHWNANHFVVLYKVKNDVYHIADPAYGKLKLEKEVFMKGWQGQSNNGIALLLEPTERFYTFEDKPGANEKKGFGFLMKYLRPYRKYVVQLFLSMLIGSLLALIFPFLTQALVDQGINHKNIGFVYLILISQLVLFVGSTAIEFIRGWVMLHMNSRINISIISDYLIKLMRLPIRFFDSKMIGDITTRISDHQRVQSFLTGPALSTLFSLVNLVIFVIILSVYSVKILAIFAIFSLCGVGWILLFLRHRKKLDYKRFQSMSDNQGVLFELISGMQEIKLNNCETTKRWGWERVQAKLFKLNIQGLALGQYQRMGSFVFNQLKNILISFVSAKEVINGSMTLGMMMSVSYIVGQLNSPIEQLLGFIQSAQDARISLDRLSEIHNKDEEDDGNEEHDFSLLDIDEHGQMNYAEYLLDLKEEDAETGGRKRSMEPGIRLNNVSFQYDGPNSAYALKDVSITIPKGKVTAIVGTSGSGKTTLMKMLLKFYKPAEGSIEVSGIDMQNISAKRWRHKCGVVSQEGFIFNDTIAGNISVSDEVTDHGRLRKAVNIANIREFIEELPLSYNTKIGSSGNGISTGQKQRLLIARAVYKDPDYLFFDEATNALDANNERIIMQNLQEFFHGKTVLVIAHRLSTVKNADQIIVLEKGEVVECGTHESLIAENGRYFELIKNQLELGGA